MRDAPPLGRASTEARGVTRCRDLETAIFLGDYAKDAVAPWFWEERRAVLASPRKEGVGMMNDECVEVAKKLAGAAE
jgi:hypothetical protein